MTDRIPVYKEPTEEDKDDSEELFSSWGYKRVVYCSSSPFDALPQGCYLERVTGLLWRVCDPGGNQVESDTAEGAIAAYRDQVLGEKLARADERYDELCARVDRLTQEIRELRHRLPREGHWRSITTAQALPPQRKRVLVCFVYAKEPFIAMVHGADLEGSYWDIEGSPDFQYCAWSKAIAWAELPIYEESR